MVAALVSGRQRIPAARIAEVASAVKVVAAELNLDCYDDWVEQHIIGKIPEPAMRLNELLGLRVIDAEG